MNYYLFEGMGNYSTNFGWDNGLSITITTTSKDVVEEKEAAFNGQLVSWNVEFQVGVSVIHTLSRNEHGGSRNVSGWVKSPSLEQATLDVFKWASEKFPETRI